MNAQARKAYLRPKDVNPAEAGKVLAFLNAAKTTEEIANAIITSTGERILSIRVAQKILDRQVQLGGFKDLKQVASVPGIGRRRFTEIVHALDKSMECLCFSLR